jgi:hypothetical protein
VKARSACSLCQLRSVSGTQTTADCHFDTLTSLFYQPRKDIRSLHGIHVSARGKDSLATRCNDIFQGTFEGRGYVEGTVKGHPKGLCQLDQARRCFHIHCAILLQQSQNDASGSELAHVQNIPFHHRYFGSRIHKISTARANQTMDRQAALRDRLTE